MTWGKSGSEGRRLLACRGGHTERLWSSHCCFRAFAPAVPGARRPLHADTCRIQGFPCSGLSSSITSLERSLLTTPP